MLPVYWVNLQHIMKDSLYINIIVVKVVDNSDVEQYCDTLRCIPNIKQNESVGAFCLLECVPDYKSLLGK